MFGVFCRTVSREWALPKSHPKCRETNCSRCTTALYSDAMSRWANAKGSKCRAQSPMCTLSMAFIATYAQHTEELHSLMKLPHFGIGKRADSNLINGVFFKFGHWNGIVLIHKILSIAKVTGITSIWSIVSVRTTRSSELPSFPRMQPIRRVSSHFPFSSH